MKHIEDRVVSLWPVLLLAFVVGPGVWAASVKPAAVEWGPNWATFAIQIESEFLLTVAGPGFDRQAQGRGFLSFRTVDEDGQQLPDGLYRYELREIVTSPELEALEAEPDHKKREALRRQLRREGRWPERPRIQHDVFRIEAGRIIVPKDKVRDAEDESRHEGAEHDHPHPR